jgi:hypothetical protein
MIVRVKHPIKGISYVGGKHKPGSATVHWVTDIQDATDFSPYAARRLLSELTEIYSTPMDITDTPKKEQE